MSEATKPNPNTAVGNWLGSQDLAETYLSVITLGEIEQGITRLGSTQRAERYRSWLETLRQTYTGHILSLDERVLQTWGRLTGEALKQGRPLALLDSLLAATAVTFDLVLVTRNTRDVATLPVKVFDPWDA